jgi:hypothetical protein
VNKYEIFKIIIIIDLFEVPSNPPLDIKVFSLSSKSLKISWKVFFCSVITQLKYLIILFLNFKATKR